MYGAIHSAQTSSDSAPASSNGYEKAAAKASSGVRAANAMLAELGAVHRALFQLDAAQAVHLEAEAVNQIFPTQPFAELVAAELCADSALAGQWVEAGAYARLALAGRGRTTVPFFGLTLWHETEALIRLGEAEAARADVRRFGERNAGNPRFRIPYLRALAVLAEADGQLNVALAHLRAAAALAEELGLPGEARWVRAALAELSRGPSGP